MRIRILRDDDGKNPGDREGVRRPGSFESERWPRTPRVIRWAWAASVSALVVAQATTDRGVESQTLIRLIHDLSELMDSRTPAELMTPGDPAAAPPPAPEPTPDNPVPAPRQPGPPVSRPAR